jgi:geranylgeranyl pyrophosphate synthase
MLDQKTNTLYHKTPLLTPSWKNVVKGELELVEDRLLPGPYSQHPVLSSTIEGLFNSGGKRVRPTVCMLTAKLFEANINQAVSLAASVEMLHTATLVHDDMIDGAILRRGAPTLNYLWSSDIAVLVGDYMFARAASLVAEVEIIPVMKLFSKTLEIILNGEITQKFSKWEIDRNAYDARIFAKTAALFVLSTHSVALLGGADEASLDAMKNFGHDIGMAFQIMDDVIDYVGTADKVGKPIGGDLRQGLFTLPAILFSEAHPSDEDISTLLKKKEADPAQVERLIQKIQKSDAIEASLAEAAALLEKAKRGLANFPASVYKDALLDLAEEFGHREY